MKNCTLSHLADDALTHRLATRSADERAALAEVVALIGEFDARRLYAPAGYSSMHEYCVRVLKLSEDMAYKRTRVASTARRFPAIFDRLADGRLNLSTALLLAPHLTEANAEALIDAASNGTRADVEQLLAERFPKADVPTTLVALPPAGAAVTTVFAPGRKVSAQLVANTKCEHATQHVEIASAARTTPLAPERFALQVTISGDTQRKLEHARELLSHAIPDKSIEHVLDRALDALIAQLEKRRTGATERPGRRTSDGKARYVPAEVKRAVWARDGSRCTFVGTNGQRCDSRTRLELDHVLPIAKGGASTVGNLRLRCRAHNQYEAERALGERFMKTKRERAIEAKQEREAAERDPDCSVVPWLRHLGVPLERARRAAAQVDALGDAPLEARLHAALRTLAPVRAAAASSPSSIASAP